MFLAGTPQVQAYRRDLFWAQAYALENRRAMLQLLLDVMARQSDLVEVVHPLKQVLCVKG